MAIRSSLSGDSKSVTIHLERRFDFSAREAFRRAYEKGPARAAQYNVDMRETRHMDSSALGMLLIMREYAGGDQANVRLINVNDEIRSILVTANFDKLVKIE